MLGKAKRHASLLLLTLLASVLLGGCLGLGKKKKTPDLNASAEPDKVLFDRAMQDIRHNRYTVARLTLQTLINTYPDSEYLAKAKLAIADSYYREGATAGLTQAIAEYKDFITFFPFLDEAAYAQLQTAMAHYRQMEKPDRDRTQVRAAEDEFQTFLLKYPKHPLAAQAEQRLREVQEVLAEGDFRIARYYYIKGSMRAAAARLLEIVERYPLYSQSDKALWMLGNSYERAEKGDLAAKFYSRIVSDYPLSDLVDNARKKLVNLGVPVPQPNPVALARMEREREAKREKPGLLRRSLGLIKTGPDVSKAARSGEPNLTPPGEAASVEVLKPSGVTVAAGSSSGGASGSAVVVETVPAGSSGGAPASSPPPTAANPPKTDQAAAEPKPAEASTAADKASATDKKEADKKEDKKKNKESSSKKKKGLRKIIPW